MVCHECAKVLKNLLSFLEMSIYTTLFKHAEHFSRHAHALFYTIYEHGNRVKIIFKRALGTVLGVRNRMTNM
jgi:hypothetical protein